MRDLKNKLTSSKNTKNIKNRRGKSFGYQVLGFGSGGGARAPYEIDWLVVAGGGGGAGGGAGGGGGAGNTSANDGGNGGSGVVILRMPTASYSATTTGSPTVTTDGADTILQFNASGSYTG